VVSFIPTLLKKAKHLLTDDATYYFPCPVLDDGYFGI
jgi:hypothetical protein